MANNRLNYAFSNTNLTQSPPPANVHSGSGLMSPGAKTGADGIGSGSTVIVPCGPDGVLSAGTVSEAPTQALRTSRSAIARRNLMVYSTEKRQESVRTRARLSFFDAATPSLDASEIPKATGFFIGTAHNFLEYLVERNAHKAATNHTHAGVLWATGFFIFGGAAVVFDPRLLGELDDLGDTAGDELLAEEIGCGLSGEELSGNLFAFLEVLAGAGLDYGVFYMLDPRIDVFHFPAGVGRGFAAVDALAFLGYEVRAFFVGQLRSPKVLWADSRNRVPGRACG